MNLTLAAGLILWFSAATLPVGHSRPESEFGSQLTSSPAHTTAAWPRARVQPSVTSSLASATSFAAPEQAPSSTPQDLAELRGRLQALEQQMKDRNELFHELNQFFWLITGLAAVGSVLTFLALFRERFSERDKTLAKNEMKFSNAMAEHTEQAAQAQIQNLVHVSGLIKFVHDAFDLQEKQKQALDELRQKQEAGFTDQIAQLTQALKAEQQREEARKRREDDRKRDAIAKYDHVVEMMGTLESIQALEWPTLPTHLLRLAENARLELETIDRDLLKGLIEAKPNEHASMLQRMGVAAYYDFYQIGIALDLLGAAERLFDTSIADETFNKARAYTQHFLAIIEKNWCLKGNSIGSNLDKAAQRLRKAIAVLGDEPGHFLTPVTLAEVLSYRGEAERGAACEVLNGIFDRVERIQVAHLDGNQSALHTRALLLRGNIEFHIAAAMTPSEVPSGSRVWYDKAAVTGSKNPYVILSLARASEPFLPSTGKTAADNVGLWTKGFDALTRSDVLRKQEMTQRVTALAWAILCASRIGAREEEARYRAELASARAAKIISGRFPLYFSPLRMTIVPYETLVKDLSIESDFSLA